MILCQTHYFALMKYKDDSVVKINILKYWFLNPYLCFSVKNFYQKHCPIQKVETAVSYDIKNLFNNSLPDVGSTTCNIIYQSLTKI
jgi:hypothetical protein